MKIVSTEIIDSISELVDTAQESFIEQTLDKFYEQQNLLFAFLIPQDEQDEDVVYSEAASELLLYLGIKVWLAFEKAGNQCTEVLEEDLQAIELQNEQMLSFLGDEDEEEMNIHFANIVENHPQRELIEFIAYFCLEAEHDDLDIDDESRLLVFIDLKIFLECLIKNCLPN